MAYTPEDGWFVKNPGVPAECRWCCERLIFKGGKVVVCPKCDEWPAHVKSETRRILREGLD